MKYQEMTFSAMLAALKRHWKAWLLTVMVFALLGAAAAFLFAGGDVPAAGHAEPLEAVDKGELERDTGYYDMLFQAIQDKYDDLEVYISELNGDSTVTREQSKALVEFYQKKMVKAYKKTLDPIQKELSKSENLLVPVEYLDELKEDLEDELAETQRNIQISLTAVDLLKSMEAPRTENESVVKEYGKLLRQAAALGEYQVATETCQRKLDRLENSVSAVRQESKAFEAELEKALKEQNALLEEANEFGAGFAEANHVNILLGKNEDGSLKVTLEHTHGADSPRQTAPVLFLFCVLVGVCAGAFLALCLEAGVLKRPKGGKARS